MAQRSPGMNANAMLTSQLQQTISQAGSLPSGAVGSGLVGLARMMSPKQQGKSVCVSFPGFGLNWPRLDPGNAYVVSLRDEIK